MALKFEQETKVMGVQFDAYFLLYDFKSQSLNVMPERLYVSLDMDNFNLY